MPRRQLARWPALQYCRGGAGGAAPQDDAAGLKGPGVAAGFGPGATTTEIVDFLKGAVRA